MDHKRPPVICDTKIPERVVSSVRVDGLYDDLIANMSTDITVDMPDPALVADTNILAIYGEIIKGEHAER